MNDGTGWPLIVNMNAEANVQMKILIADDHPLFREAMHAVVGRLCAARGHSFVWQEVSHTAELFEAVRKDDELDLILLDLFRPGAAGLADLVALRHESPATAIVIVSTLEDNEVVRRALACGAAGYVFKSAAKAEMNRALELVLDGRIYDPQFETSEPTAAAGSSALADPLTPRQVAVLALLAEGQSNKQIARELGISDVTVKVHITAILRKLGVSTRAQAIVAFQRGGLTAPRLSDAR